MRKQAYLGSIACPAIVLLLIGVLTWPRGVAAATEVQTIQRFKTNERVIALTFDAGDDRGATAEILDTLADRKVQVSFGLTGVWSSENADLVRRIVRDGHHVINHSWDHAHFTMLTSAQRRAQLKRTEDLIQSQVDVKLAPYFRPPFGEYNAAVLADLKATGYLLNVMWTVDTLGWNGKTAEEINRRVLAGAAPGAIILMHVGAVSQDSAALPEMIDTLRSRGYRFATVQQFVSGTLPPPERWFPQTNQVLKGEFLQYWERNGGLPVFGYPLSPQRDQPNADTGKLHPTQYLERQRFELHSANRGTPYEVLLGRLGVELLDKQGRDWRAAPKADPRTPHYFAATGQAIAPQFWDYWRTHGLDLGDRGISEREAIALFGYPITPAQMETNPSGHRVLTQWFERARFEYHPNNPPASRVLLGRLGAEMVDG